MQCYCIILSLQLWFSFNCTFTLFFLAHISFFLSHNFNSGVIHSLGISLVMPLVVYAAHVVVLENLKMYFFHSLSLSFVTLYGMCLHFPTRIKLAPLHWKHRALITGLLGSPHPYFEKYFFSDFKNPNDSYFLSTLQKYNSKFFQCSFLVFAHSATLAFISIAGIY